MKNPRRRRAFRVTKDAATPLPADERDPERDHPLSLVCERLPYRSGTYPRERRRLRGFSPNLPDQPAERFRSRGQRHPHARSVVPAYCQMRATIPSPASGWAKTAGSRCWTSSQPGTPRPERAAPLTLGLCPLESRSFRAALFRPRPHPGIRRSRVAGHLVGDDPQRSARTKNSRAAAASRRYETRTLIAWPCRSTARYR
jgi:hypothetical protein